MARRRDEEAQGRVWADAFARALNLPQAATALVLVRRELEDGLAGNVLGRGGVAEASVRFAPMDDVARTRWLRALGLSPSAPTPGPGTVGARALAAGGGQTPAPRRAEVAAVCACGRTVGEVWCEHVLALARDGAGLIAVAPSRLWMWRGLGPAAGTVAPPASHRLARGVLASRAHMRRRVRDGATTSGVRLAGVAWADYGLAPVGPGAPGAGAETDPPWIGQPRALVRLGPLPHASGQADAVRPIEAIWLEMRDRCAALLRPAKVGRSRPRGAKRPVE